MAELLRQSPYCNDANELNPGWSVLTLPLTDRNNNLRPPIFSYLVKQALWSEKSSHSYNL